jgi:hypothetical protein
MRTWRLEELNPQGLSSKALIGLAPDLVDRE